MAQVIELIFFYPPRHFLLQCCRHIPNQASVPLVETLLHTVRIVSSFHMSLNKRVYQTTNSRSQKCNSKMPSPIPNPTVSKSAPKWMKSRGVVPPKSMGNRHMRTQTSFSVHHFTRRVIFFCLSVFLIIKGINFLSNIISIPESDTAYSNEPQTRQFS